MSHNASMLVHFNKKNYKKIWFLGLKFANVQKL